MRIMGLDLGTKRIGVALSDEMCILGQARDTIARISDEKAIDRIEEMILEFKVGQVVVGLPVNMDGTEGERAVDSRRFGEKIKRRTGLSVIFWDERLSTKEVEDVLIRASVRRDKRKELLDKLAAQVILQSYLDSRD
jgi:putative holliday junction resolvase